MRMKYLNQIAQKCHKLPNTEFKQVIEEFQAIHSILSQIEQEVYILSKSSLTGK